MKTQARCAPSASSGGASNDSGRADKRAGRKSGARRAELLEIAASLFAENGFSASTMSQISDAAGILSGSLYHHFSTKEQILHELMKPFGEKLVREYREIALSAGSANENLERILRHAFIELQRDHTLHTIMYNERKFIRRTPEFVYLADYGMEILRIVYGVLLQGVREGTIREDINLDLATSTVLRLTNVLVDSYEPEGRFSVDDILELELTLIMDGLRTRS